MASPLLFSSILLLLLLLQLFLPSQGTNFDSQNALDFEIKRSLYEAYPLQAYYGVQAKFSAWGLPVGRDQYTASLIGLTFAQDSVQAGWHITPAYYGDNDTHFFVFWMAGEKSCYNLDCPGFVRVHSSTTKAVPGAKIWPLSTYNGKKEYLHCKIFKDGKTGDWWVYEGPKNHSSPVGYFPKSLFSNLAESAYTVVLGGVAAAPKKELPPPIGNGHDARKRPGKAAAFEDIQFIDQAGASAALQEDEFGLYEQSDCYSLTEVKVEHGKGSFYYGGHGGC